MLGDDDQNSCYRAINKIFLIRHKNSSQRKTEEQQACDNVQMSEIPMLNDEAKTHYQNVKLESSLLVL